MAVIQRGEVDIGRGMVATGQDLVAVWHGMVVVGRSGDQAWHGGCLTRRPSGAKHWTVRRSLMMRMSNAMSGHGANEMR